MGNRRGNLTAREIEARRCNARKSTGPRTPRGKKRSRLNAMKYGVYSQAQSFHSSMVELGERPEEFLRLLRTLIAARSPADGVEMMLIEEIAILEWKKARLDRAEAGVQATNLQKLLADRRHRALEVGRDGPDVSQAEVLRVGLRRIVNSPSKFEDLLDKYDLLVEGVKKNELPPGAETIFKALYGEEPSMRGVHLIDLARIVANSGGTENQVEQARQELEMELYREIRDVAEEYQLYLEEHVEVTRAQRNAALAPTPYDWHVMIRHENALNRQIEQKLRLLESIQRRRRNEELRIMSLTQPSYGYSKAGQEMFFDKTKQKRH